jgi:hypothetical protein
VKFDGPAMHGSREMNTRPGLVDNMCGETLLLFLAVHVAGLCQECHHSVVAILGNKEVSNRILTKKIGICTSDCMSKSGQTDGRTGRRIDRRHCGTYVEHSASGLDKNGTSATKVSFSFGKLCAINYSINI